MDPSENPDASKSPPKTPPKAAQKARQRVEFRETFERNFITHEAAMKEFLLKPTQLEGLKKQVRRSPYETEVSIVVYNRKDVEKKAIEIWGSLENIERERKNRDTRQIIDDKYNYEFKKNLRDARRNEDPGTSPKVQVYKKKTNEPFIIAIALLVDVMNLSFKAMVWYHINSDSMLAETIHSVADTINQSILAIGLCQIAQKANPKHPYGYSNTMYVVSLISGVGIFCLGAAVSVFKGVLTLMSHHAILFTHIEWAFAVLTFSGCTEAVSFGCSVVATYKDAKRNKVGFFYYAFRGVEPGLTVILMEDFVAVIGNILAGAMLAASWCSGSFIPDAVGSVLIGALLGAVALFLIVTNAAALVGRSIREERLEEINKVLESDVMIRAIYDVKGIDIGNSLVRYKAEIDFDGAELSRLYLDHVDLNELLASVKEISNVDDLENFIITHGENIVDLLGSEIDRIEMKVRNLFPEVRHMDLEIL